jgi:hypothetical protein
MDLTYEDIDRLGELLQQDKLHEKYTQKDLMTDIIRLLVTTLKNNRFLADNIQKVVTEGRLSLRAGNEALNLCEKVISKNKHLEKNLNFLLGSKSQFDNESGSKGMKIG